MPKIKINGNEFNFMGANLTFYDVIFLAVGRVRHPENYTVNWVLGNGTSGTLAPGGSMVPQEGLSMVAFVLSGPQWTLPPVN